MPAPVGGSGIDVFGFWKGDGATEIEDIGFSRDMIDVEGVDHFVEESLTAAGRQVGDDRGFPERGAHHGQNDVLARLDDL